MCVQDFAAIVEAVFYEKALEAFKGDLELGVQHLASLLEKKFPKLLGSIDNVHETFGSTAPAQLLARFNRLTKKYKYASQARPAVVGRAKTIIMKTQLYGVP